MERSDKFGHKRLLEFEDFCKSKLGGSIPGERAVFRGRDVFNEFKHWSWLKMLYFCVIGTEPAEETEKFLNGLYCTCFNFSDPRIWNNRVAALAATASSTAQLGVCAASAISEAEIYGGPPVSEALSFLLEAKKKFDRGETIKDIVDIELNSNGVLYGFGRPINKNDERIIPTLNLLKELNLYDRPYIQFALKIQNELLSRKNKTGFNIGGVMAAFCADDGMTPKQLYQLMVVCFYVGQLACYIESDSKIVGSFYPLRCNKISYSGHKGKVW